MDFVIRSNYDYRKVLEYLRDNGTKVPSRIGYTSELLGVNLVLPTGLLLYRPGMSRQLGWVEGLQVVGASFNQKQLALAAPKLVHPYTIHQAYGIKLATQLPKVAEQLLNFPGTRRAILHIGQPMDGQESEKPCMQSYQFIQRGNLLHTFIYARSWDFVSGFIYDIMVASMVNVAMARVLGIAPGNIYGMIASLHVYHSDFEKFPQLIHDEKSKMFSLFPSMQFEKWDDAREWANANLETFPWPNKVPFNIEVK